MKDKIEEQMFESMIFGHSYSYWLELEKYAKELNVITLIEEITRLRGKVSFYETRINEMSILMTSNKN
jgi:hypothetical protein